MSPGRGDRGEFYGVCVTWLSLSSRRFCPTVASSAFAKNAEKTVRTTPVGCLLATPASQFGAVDRQLTQYAHLVPIGTASAITR